MSLVLRGEAKAPQVLGTGVPLSLLQGCGCQEHGQLGEEPPAGLSSCSSPALAPPDKIPVSKLLQPRSSSPSEQEGLQH